MKKKYFKYLQQSCKSELSGRKIEIIFVNDSSDDKIFTIIGGLIWEEKYLFTLSKKIIFERSQKKELLDWDRKAKGEIIVTTECGLSHPNDWLKNLLKFMDDYTGFISGPVEFKSNGNLFGKMQKLELPDWVITGARINWLRKSIF